MAILIVGGAGYIGSHTAKLVAAAGQKPIVFDNLVYGCAFGHRERQDRIIANAGIGSS